tara:strand:+ start:2217 stop:2399 length:183 start_codon:yes stop_codon:yes gene_type:complete
MPVIVNYLTEGWTRSHLPACWPRLIVCSPISVELFHPSETVLDLLDTWPKGPLKKMMAKS